MSKLKAQIFSPEELLIGKYYRSNARFGEGEIVQVDKRGDIHFPNGFVFAVRVRPTQFASNPIVYKDFWATLLVANPVNY
jgi:hypothetical protein